MGNKRLYKADVSDNVAVGLDSGMKYAAQAIRCGEDIIKYGAAIGRASRDIVEGEAVHVGNVRSLLEGVGGYAPFRPFGGETRTVADETQAAATFGGYRRTNGKTGIRNDIYVIPTVGCVNGICERIAAESGALPLTHPYGCSQLGDDHERTVDVLCGLASNPNAGGVLIVSLGCENNTQDSFKEALEAGGCDMSRVRFMTAQRETDEIACGLRLTEELKEIASGDRRTQRPASELVIGLKCGGSDGLSGITANPLVGKITDKVVSYGATAVMTEIPEMFGAEDILLSRCADRGTYDSLVNAIDGFKNYYISHGERIDENPSPGNKAGGITTLAEKSMGCVQKGGTSAVTDVIAYGGRVMKKGLNVLIGPGNDIVACTALAAAGVQVILFTTGRGTPLGCSVPVVKISTNTALAQRKPRWIDFDAGRLISGADRQTVADELFGLVMRVAGGEATRSESNGFREIAVWKNGVTL